MTYSKLPPVRQDKILYPEYFPSRFHAAVFRLWETVSAADIARAVGTTADVVRKTAKDMGLPEQKYTDKWSKLGYITTIRNAWHILPYEQMLLLLGWDEDKLASVLKEEDFLGYKLGSFKPYCENVKVENLNENQICCVEEINSIMHSHFDGMFDGAEPFEFFCDSKKNGTSESNDGLRLIYSYCGLYAAVLDNDISLSYPDKLMEMYSSLGINAVWIPVVLYQMVEFPFDSEYSEGWRIRQQRLKALVEKGSKYGIRIYLYLNEPRCMPIDFFDKHPDLMGRKTDMYAALCTENSTVMQYLRSGVRTLCEAVPDIGGFFAITCSENLTHCKSKFEGEPCQKCKDVPISKLVSNVICAISEESRKVNPDIRTIAWTWAWDDYMTDEEIRACIDALPKEVVIQCNSEAKKEFVIGGVKGRIADYSMSIPGPAEFSKGIWNYAKCSGHEVCAKVQVNVTWECSTLPFLPVFDLVREHVLSLKKAGVEHLMLSWTLGGYPSINLKIASECLEDDSEEKYDKLLLDEYGDYAGNVKRASKYFSEAFREFPFDIMSIYKGPQNAGPSNFLYLTPTHFDSTMTCFAYDDLDGWRSIYPRDVYINQLRKLSEGWEKGLEEIKDMPECEFTMAAKGGYALFRSSYLQAEFVHRRNVGDKEALMPLVHEDEKMALLMYDHMKKSSLFGYEAANHYYFNKFMLAEKVINCEYLKKKFEK